jgi:hypothetical protein
MDLKKYIEQVEKKFKPDGVHLISSLPELLQEKLKGLRVGDTLLWPVSIVVAGLDFGVFPSTTFTVTKISEKEVSTEGATCVTSFGG